jgi:cation diffusion facilitator family transporter
MAAKKSLKHFAWLSIGAAILTILFKASAYFLTGSVGLLSDALESIVNLVTAIMALAMIKVAEKPPDDDHAYGHSKAEYFSSVTEGVCIILAAVIIFITAFQRILHPQAIDQPLLGLIASFIGGAINLVVAVILLRAGKKHRSIILKADGHHLLTDVWTTAGVLAGIALISITKIHILDPIIAIVVAINILITGFSLIKQSALGLMDTALPKDERDVIEKILKKHCIDSIQYHGLLTRQSGVRRFMSVHILVPGAWTVQKGHDYLEEIEKEICKALPSITVITHIEPVEDPKAMHDISIDREEE